VYLQVTLVTNSESTTVAELSSRLGVTVSEVFTTAEVATVTYPPPPPAPGFQDDLSGDKVSDEDGLNVALIAGIVGGLGGLCCMCAAGALLFFQLKKNKRPSKMVGGPASMEMDVNTPKV